MSSIGTWLVPLFFLFVVVVGLIRRVRVFDCFVAGAKAGIGTAFKILPALTALIVGISMLRSSGAIDMLVSLLRPAADFLGIPADMIPLVLLRPVSGSGSLAVLEDILRSNPPDSFTARMASIFQGSNETIFYITALYFGSVGIQKSRHTIPAALIADFVGLMAASVAARLFY